VDARLNASGNQGEPRRRGVEIWLRSARVRREEYVGEWLPEPVITGGRDDPARQAQMADSLSLAMLVLLESLSPEQRAVPLLHDVFDFDHPCAEPAPLERSVSRVSQGSLARRLKA
jgi:hypothetical protein